MKIEFDGPVSLEYLRKIVIALDAAAMPDDASMLARDCQALSDNGRPCVDVEGHPGGHAFAYIPQPTCTARAQDLRCDLQPGHKGEHAFV